MRALVTGHLGYVGVVLAPLLRKAGWQVTGLDIGLFNRCDYGGHPESIPSMNKDVRDVVASDLEGFDVVFHLAGLSNDPLGNIDPQLTADINLDGTVKLARAARSAGVSRFIFSSSCSNYGASSGGWLTEQSVVNPVTPYAHSKVQSERELLKLATENFAPVFLRSGTAYGFSNRIRFDLVANNLTAWAMATGEVLLKSDGTAWRPLVHVEDMARAFLLVATAEQSKVIGQAFNVGVNEDCMQIRDLAKIVEQEVAGSRIVFAPGKETDARTYRVDCSKIAALGYQPAWNVRSGIRQLRAKFAQFGVSVDAFEGKRYQRVAHLKELMRDGHFDSSLRRVETCVD